MGWSQQHHYTCKLVSYPWRLCSFPQQLPHTLTRLTIITTVPPLLFHMSQPCRQWSFSSVLQIHCFQPVSLIAAKAILPKHGGVCFPALPQAWLLGVQIPAVPQGTMEPDQSSEGSVTAEGEKWLCQSQPSRVKGKWCLV